MAWLIVLALLVIPASVDAATYYVSKTGTNASCATITGYANGKTSIAAGLACLTAGSGDTLLIDDGIYAESIAFGAIKSGADANNRTIIKARNPGLAIIRPASSAGCTLSATTVVIVSGGTSFVEFDGIGIDANFVCAAALRFRSQENGGAITNIRFKNGFIRNLKPASVNAGGALVSGSANNTSGSESTGDITGTFNNIDLINNEIYTSSDGNSCVSFDPSDSLWEGNFVHDCGLHGMTSHHAGAGGLRPQSNVTARNNVIKNAKAGCFQFSIPSTIYNNVCIFTGGGNKVDGSALGTGVFDITKANTSSGSTVTNVKYWNNSSFGHFGSNSIACFRIGSTSTGGSHEFRNNICFTGVGDGIQRDTGSGTVTVSNNRCASGCTTTVDPLYQNTAVLSSCTTEATCAAAMHLTALSPSQIINAGVTIGSFATDFDGLARPQGAAWDLGAFEFILTPPEPPGPPWHRGRLRR